MLSMLYIMGSQRRQSLLFTSSPLLTLLLMPFFLFLLCFPVPASAARSAVLGIDLGTEYLKAALVKPGIPLEVVLTKDSKRKESAAVAFKPSTESNALFPERFYGGDALALAARFPDDVYVNLKILLGVSFENSEVVRMYADRYPALKLEQAPHSRNTVGLRSQKLGDAEGKDAFLVEEILAMQLKQVKENADALAGRGSNIQDAVITYPAYYTAEEKRSVELAAELAGLNVEALISDGLAVGLNYATSRTFPSVSDGQNPEYHLVYDMGAGSTTATVLRFQSRTVKDVGRFNKTVQEVHVLGAGWDRTLGGDALNQLIVDDMVNKFVHDKKLKSGTTIADIKSDGKTMAKLWKDSEKVRQILSANTETSSTFEGLYEEDVNFKYKISRAKFEKLTQEHANRVQQPLDDALATAGLKLSDLDSVILHGGAIRTPFVQKQLEKTCGGFTKLRTSVNADEAAVFGAAFKGAALSPSFRVKDIRAADAASYSFKVKWTSDGKNRQQKLFTPTSQIGVEKQITVKNLDDFELNFYQQIAEDDDPPDAPVLKVRTQNLTASVTQLKDKFGCIPANITTKFSIRLSPVHGLPEVLSGVASCEVDKKGSVVDDVKGFFGLGTKKEDQEPLKAEDEQPKESITLQEETSTSTTETSISSATGAAKAPSELKTKVESIPIGLSSSTLGTPALSPSELSRIKNRLAAFDVSDRERILREEALNELEAFIYRGRDLVEDDEFLKVLKEDQVSMLKEKLESTSEWLYGDGVHAKTKDFQGKLTALKEIIDPAIRRKNENDQRGSKMALIEEMLKGAKAVIEVMEQQIRSDEEAFSSAQASASSSTSVESSSETLSSSTSSAASAEQSPESLANLEDDPYSTSSSSTKSSKASITSFPPKLGSPSYSIYTPVDLSSLNRVYESIKAWFETQKAIQEQLTESDDPALMVADMDSRLRELERILTRIYQKMGTQPESSESSSSKKKGEGKKASENKKKAEKAKSSQAKTSTTTTKSANKDEL